MDEEDGEDYTSHQFMQKMSLNDTNGTPEEYYTKDSFDRYGDDLLDEMCIHFKNSLEFNDQLINKLSIKEGLRGMRRLGDIESTA
ncbi:unnamed protein product [Oppiella nova]|uniref:Uncharacterized protein n=1 Tax=Oppiella nova TaxID=334625 RepID=A0A7R9QWQ6_9ACAR|nr:unnamed protein product [Oppiella nova]CAG2177195.1 unnamed protein product [Oppiella nova]